MDSLLAMCLAIRSEKGLRGNRFEWERVGVEKGLSEKRFEWERVWIYWCIARENKKLMKKVNYIDNWGQTSEAEICFAQIDFLF